MISKQQALAALTATHTRAGRGPGQGQGSDRCAAAW
jgi:hypothetical protein